MPDENESPEKPCYTWPWFLLAALVFGLALTVFWMSVLVRRTREQRETNPWPPASQSAPQTNSPAVKTNAVKANVEEMSEFPTENVRRDSGPMLPVIRARMTG